MKTKFSEILKIKNQKVSEIEQQLSDIRAKKKTLMTQLEQSILQIKNYALPDQGNFVSMKSARCTLEYMYKDKEQKENMIKYLNQEIENLNILYKEANIDYEKIKYLHELEKKNILEKLLKEENKQMDEIANQLFLIERFKKKGDE